MYILYYFKDNEYVNTATLFSSFVHTKALKQLYMSSIIYYFIDCALSPSQISDFCKALKYFKYLNVLTLDRIIIYYKVIS